ncbi:glycosyltransferase family 2 protein [Paraburkholderia humisilvae]|nr:glycosyltransferase family 2 protein [Paraburkholderia humisilvae]
MTAPVKVSICLPTYQRPDLIGQSLDSCLAQTHTNIEVLIGDDSTDDRTRSLIEARYAADPRVRYVKNTPSLGQARNVESLFARATGDRILLIHDDDFLVGNAVERMLSAWPAHPDVQVAFGDQYVTDSRGTVLPAASEHLNRAYHRTRDVAGLQKQPGRTGLVQMFPNNGWMADADLVKRIGYREQNGVACDYVFGTEICLAAKGVYYLNEYVSYNRQTEVSITTSTRASTSASTLVAYNFLRALELPPQLEPARRLALRRMVPIVVSIYARNHAPLESLKLALSHLSAYNYGFSRRLYFHLLIMAKSLLTARTSAL